MTSNNAYQCCFCGREILPRGADVGGLIYTTNVDSTEKEQYTQELWCHGGCLKNLIHSSVPLFAFDLAQEPDSELD